MEKKICKHCKQPIKEYPSKIKSFSQWRLITTGDKSLRRYRFYVSRMENRLGIEQTPDAEEMLRAILEKNAELRDKIERYEENLIEAYNSASKLAKYRIFYERFETYIKQKVATKLGIPVTDISQALFMLELKSQLIKHKFKL